MLQVKKAVTVTFSPSAAGEKVNKVGFIAGFCGSVVIL